MLLLAPCYFLFIYIAGCFYHGEADDIMELMEI